MKAVIKTGGKQYAIEQGQTIKVGKIEQELNNNVEIKEVLMVLKDGETKVGKPFIDNASVEAKVLSHGKHKKVINFKYKSKKGFHKTKGHRQDYTEIEITKING